MLRNEADHKKIWDESIEKIDTDSEPDTAKIKEFLSNAHYYDHMKERKALLGQIAYVSKKIMDEGWKIGYMCRDEAIRVNECIQKVYTDLSMIKIMTADIADKDCLGESILMEK